MEDLDGLDDDIMNHNDLASFLEDQMEAIKTIITDHDEENESEEGPQIEYDSSAYKSIDSWNIIEQTSGLQSDSTKKKLKSLFNFLSPSKTIVEEEESKETSVVVESNQKMEESESIKSTPTLSIKWEQIPAEK